MSAREILERYKKEINSHAFERLAPLLSKDCTFWFSSGTFKGLEESRRAFERTWNLIQDEVYTVHNVEWISDSETSAACIYTFHWKGLVGGEEREGSGRGTSCFRLEEDGWKLIHEHLSPFPKQS